MDTISAKKGGLFPEKIPIVNETHFVSPASRLKPIVKADPAKTTVGMGPEIKMDFFTHCFKKLMSWLKEIFVSFDG